MITLRTYLSYAFVIVSLLQPITNFATNLSLQHGVDYQVPDNINEYWVSEKLDGVRGFWDGRQLFTRTGRLINTPTWFTQNWPEQPLDGELWIGRQQFAKVSAIVRKHSATDEEWRQIKFMLFDLSAHPGNFSERLQLLEQLVKRSNDKHLQLIQQQKVNTVEQLTEQLNRLIAAGAEGLMLHHQDAIYQSGRNPQLMKLKLRQDAEAVVVGYLPGKGAFQGIMGALKVKTDDGKEFNIGTGFTLIDRQQPPAIGSIITFEYSGLTKFGLPRFASYLRQRPSQ